MMMEAPIPGQSLTAEPGAAQYERPPKFAKPEQAFEAYLDKFDDPEAREGLFALLERDVPLMSVVNLLTREAVRNGVHSIDVAVILRPMVHEYLSVLADAAGVNYIEAPEDPYKEDALKKKEKALIASRVEQQLGETAEEEDDEEAFAEEIVEEVMDEEDDEDDEEEGREEMPAKPKGLMQRRTS